MDLKATITLLHADGRVEELPTEAVGVEVGEYDASDRSELSLRVTAREPFEGCIRLEVQLPACEQPHWLVPGLVYGDVRPGPLAGVEAEEWGFRCDRAATTAVFGWCDDGGVALHVPEASAVGEHGLGFGVVDGAPRLRVHWPYREEPHRYDGTNRLQPPELKTHAWQVREEHELHVTLYRLRAGHQEYARVIRSIHEHMAGDAPHVEDEAELAASAALAAEGLHRWHYRSDPPRLIETATFDREQAQHDRDAMHVSWVSGVPFAHALLRHGRRVGNDAYVSATLGVIDLVADNLTPGGTFWGQWTASKGWAHGWHRDQQRLHSRTLGDAALFLARALRDEPGHGNWRSALRSNLDAIVRAQRDDGALPAALSVDDASPLDWAGTSGLAWIAALLLGAELLDEPAFADTARRAGTYFLEAVHADRLLGAPEDVATAPTSEDGYMAVMAYVALDQLYPADERWLAAATHAADFTHTFRYTYDVAFDLDSDLGCLGFRTRGADQASPTNQHVHMYGLIALPEWTYLARRLGDDHYLRTAREHLAFARQCLVRADGDMGGMAGMVAERFFQTDYLEPKGTLGRLSHAWCVGLLLQACEDALTTGAPPS